MADHFYAATVRRSGVFHFATEAERAEWCDQMDGFHVAAERIDPEIRERFEAPVTVRLPGTVYGELSTCSNWPVDCPEGWEQIEAGTDRRVGRGYQRVAALDRAHAVDLADYLESVAGCSGGGMEYSPFPAVAGRAAARIREVLA